ASIKAGGGGDSRYDSEWRMNVRYFMAPPWGSDRATNEPGPDRHRPGGVRQGASQAERAADRAASTRLALSAGEPRRERKVCSWATTAAPSPMAAPTRFTEPERTSPTAKMPSTPVSIGRRTCSVEPTSAPVRMKPLSSRGTPQPASQLAAGSAPVKGKKSAMAS